MATARIARERPLVVILWTLDPNHSDRLLASFRCLKADCPPATKIRRPLPQLRSEKVGSIGDWQVIRSRLCGQPAMLEKALHDRLANYRESRHYMRHRIPRKAHELFSCSKRTALKAWDEIVALRSEW